MLSRWLCLLGVLLSPGLALSVGHRDQECRECHSAEWDRYQQSRMARAASSEDFRTERLAAPAPEVCDGCHRFGASEGIGCRGCHIQGEHPVARVDPERSCSRCHDAPGESTFRHFRAIRAQLGGKDCIDCHMRRGGARGDHNLLGPMNDPEMLVGVARLRVFLQSTQNGERLQIRIANRAGHAIPGGTTGRQLTLQVVVGEDSDSIWQRCWRFGWERTISGSWVERTLPPLVPTIIETDLPSQSRGRLLSVQLSYQYRPQEGCTISSDAVKLDSLKMSLPGSQWR